MADAAVELVLNNIKELQLYHSDLITDNKKQIESLQTDLLLFNAYLKDSQQKRKKEERTKVLVQHIRDVVFEVEDVIDAFVTQALEKNPTSSFCEFWKPSVDLHEIGEKVEAVKEEVERERINFANLSVHDEDKYGRPKAQPPRQKDIVGHNETEKLIDRLTSETDYFDVVCLTSMFGVGKTTLAWIIFNDPRIASQFVIRIWLPISQEFSDKDIFLSILEHFTIITDDIRQKDDKDIARVVADYLERGSFLIVFDDVWTRDDWDRLTYALSSNNTKGKVLITSRIDDVGCYACKPRPPYPVRFFHEDESWELLRLEAFRTLECPPELERCGRIIANKCSGLPLAIVIIGGMLADARTTTESWEKLTKQVFMYSTSADIKDRMNNFISFSYDELPYHLRACFLYLGMFPEDYEIPASKLILMWIGEGFIQQSNDSSLEETGEKYLEDLINRNLVRVEKIKRDGKVKTCRIHDAIRDFCRTEAGNENENFLQEIMSINGVFSPSLSDLNKYRRLSLHFNCLKFISSKPFGPRIRSFVCFSKDEFILPSENVPDIFKAFKLLRVLDVKPIIFPNVNSNLFQLVHLRYIVLSFDLPTLHSKYSKLWNLQTLIVNTTSKTLDVRMDIWKMIHLRHFKTNACASLPKPTKDSKHGSELQTLGTISVESCSDELLQRASNLKTLCIRGQLSLLLEGSFDSLGRMRNLENLKLINDLHSQKLSGLPQPYKFPSRLKSLTLRATLLDWSNMSILGSLANLEVLKLKDKAFMGNSWVALDGGFRCLEFMLVDDTDLAVWTASSHHYPRLRGLVLRNCEKLVAVPLGLASIGSLQMLELYNSKSAVNSARNIQEAKARSVFKLSVFPFTD